MMTNQENDVTLEAKRTTSRHVEGGEEWLEVVESALQGLHHALNNRIGSLSAVVELFRGGDIPAEGSGFRSLAAELPRLEDCARLVRLLARDGVVGEEPLILDDVIADVMVIHQFLHDVRDLPVTIAPMRLVEPVRVERWALVRVLTLLLREAKRVAAEVGAVVRAVSESDEQWVRVEFRVGPPGADSTPVALGCYSEKVAERFGGTVKRHPGAVELRLPTLKARRASERQ